MQIKLPAILINNINIMVGMVAVMEGLLQLD